MIVSFKFKAKPCTKVAGSRFFIETHILDVRKNDFDKANDWAKQNLKYYFTGEFEFIGIEFE